MDWWSAYVEARTDGTGLIEDDAVGAFASLAHAHHGVVSAGGEPPRWAAQISIEAARADTAATGAVRIVSALADQAGLPAWPVARVEATREDVLAEDLPVPR
ncbi:MAG: hypothetical protein ACRDOK_06450 [Streptosporangiaceae bacterium]